MIEKSIIHVGGSPGSGKSRMANALVERLHQTTDVRAEHLSIGEQVRLLARGAIHSTFQRYIALHLANPHTANDPLDDEIISELLTMSLTSIAERDIDLLFLDGYPRYNNQVDSYFDYANAYGYATPGALIAEVDMITAMARIQKRGRDHTERSTDPAQAWDKIVQHNESYPEVLGKLGALGLRFRMYQIDTSGPKHQTDHQAFEGTMRLIGAPLPKTA